MQKMGSDFHFVGRYSHTTSKQTVIMVAIRKSGPTLSFNLDYGMETWLQSWFSGEFDYYPCPYFDRSLGYEMSD